MTELTLVIGNKNYSSWSFRPWLAMKEFDLQFNEIRIPLCIPGSAEKIRHYSPSGRVPILLHGSQTIWDSLAIMEYLAEEFPDLHWFPEDKTARAIARCISAEMHSGFFKIRENMPMNCRARYPGKGMALGVPQEIDRITTIWRECRQKFGGNGDMLFGKFTIADAMYAPVVLRFVTYGVEVDRVCQDYMEAILGLTAMQEWLKAAEVEEEVLTKYEF